MATEPLRLCVNCKHYQKGRTFNCRRDVELARKVSPVDGKTRIDEAGGDEARIERKYGGRAYCGPEAKYYVEKRLTKRLIAWFKA